MGEGGQVTAKAIDRAVPAAFLPILDQMQSDSGGLFGASCAEIEPLEHAARQFSDTLRVRIRFAEHSTLAFVKIARPKSPADQDKIGQRIQRDFETTTRLYAALSGMEGIATVRPIACYPQYGGIVTEEASGTTLLDTARRAVRRGASSADHTNLQNALSRLGTWLRALQSLPVSVPPSSVEAIAEYVDVRLKRMVSHSPTMVSPTLRDGVLRAIRSATNIVPPDELSGVQVHADLALGNVLAAADRITVLDFDMVSTGVRYHDLSHVYMQLHLLTAKPWFSARRVEESQAYLLEAFEPGLTARRALFRVLLAQHMVCHLEALLVRRAGFAEHVFNRFQIAGHRGWLEEFSLRGVC